MAIEKDDKKPGYEASGIGAAAVTPSDANNLNQIARALWIGTGGDVALDLINPNTLEVSKNILFKNVPSGYMLDVFCRKVLATPNLTILGENEIIYNATEQIYEIGAVFNPAWEASERATWETRLDNFGLALPEQVINDRRLVQWALQTFNARGQLMINERNYRLGSTT